MNDNEAIRIVLTETDPKCHPVIIKRFWDAREEGLPTEQAMEKAAFLHNHIEHRDGIDNVNWDTFSCHTDAEMENVIAEQLFSQNQDGRAQERVDLTIQIYRKYRSWGGNIFYSGMQAAEACSIMWKSLNPRPEPTREEIYEKLAMCPDKKLADLMIDSFNKFLEIGMPIDKAAFEALEMGSLAIDMRDRLQRSTGKNVGFDYFIGDPNDELD